MTGDAARWCSCDEAAALLGLSPEALRRLALRRGWLRRHDPAGGTLVAVPEAVRSPTTSTSAAPTPAR